MKKLELKVQKRKVLGRKVKKLRTEGVLPANVYGKGVKSEAIQIDSEKFTKVYQETGETGVINLKIEGEKKDRPVLIHNVQLHPVSDLPLHADFHQVSLKEKTTVEVPVELVGEAPAEKSGEGILVTLLGALEVESLPADLPEKLEADVSRLEKIDDVVRVKDIKVDEKKVKILAAENEIVAKIEPPAKEEEAPPLEPEEAAEEAPAEEEAVEEKPQEKAEPVKPEKEKKAGEEKSQPRKEKQA